MMPLTASPNQVDAIEIISTALAALGAGSGGGAVVAIKVNIAYMTKEIERNERALERAHTRIDDLEARCH
jgi:hypothetical protein